MGNVTRAPKMRSKIVSLVIGAASTERFSPLTVKIAAKRAANVSEPKRTRSAIVKHVGGVVWMEKFSRQHGQIAKTREVNVIPLRKRRRRIRKSASRAGSASTANLCR